MNDELLALYCDLSDTDREMVDTLIERLHYQSKELSRWEHRFRELRYQEYGDYYTEEENAARRGIKDGL